jgi:uncharacterized protein
MQETDMTRIEAATDIALALVVMFVAAVVLAAVVLLLPADAQPPLLVLVLAQGVVILAGIALLLARRRAGWRQLGLIRIQWRDVPRAAGALLVMLAASYLLGLMLEWLIPGVMEAHSEGLVQVARQLVGELPFVLVAAGMLFVGFYEEVVARGLLLQRCRRIFGGIWVPVLMSSLLFGLGHYYQGWPGMMQTALIGVVLARLTIYWGTLWPAIFGHAALNSVTLGLTRLAENLA